MDDDRHGDVESSLNQSNGIVAVDYDLLVEVEWSQPIEHSPSITETNQSSSYVDSCCNKFCS